MRHRKVVRVPSGRAGAARRREQLQSREGPAEWPLLTRRGSSQVCKKRPTILPRRFVWTTEGILFVPLKARTGAVYARCAESSPALSIRPHLRYSNHGNSSISRSRTKLGAVVPILTYRAEVRQDKVPRWEKS